MSKYKISREFFPFSHFTPPISEKFLAMSVPHMKTPKSIFKDKELDTVKVMKRKQSELCQQEQKNMTQAEIELAEKILTIRSQAQKPMKRNVKNIRQARQTEQMKLHKDFVREVM